jgi:uncharacterized protein (TIGR00369 family)
MELARPAAPIPTDPAYADRVRESFSRQNFMAALGAVLVAVEPGRVEIELPYRADLTQQHGFFHAGATTSIADSAGGYAGYTLFPANSSVLTVEFKMNLLAPARGEKLSAIGQVIKSGRTLTICDLKVFAVSDGQKALCASGQQTLICLHDRPDQGPAR